MEPSEKGRWKEGRGGGWTDPGTLRSVNKGRWRWVMNRLEPFRLDGRRHVRRHRRNEVGRR